MAKKRQKEIAIRSSAAEYLTFVRRLVTAKKA